MESIDKCPRGEFTRTNITRGKSAPTKLKNQFPTHFLFIVNLTILYQKSILQEKNEIYRQITPGQFSRMATTRGLLSVSHY